MRTVELILFWNRCLKSDQIVRKVAQEIHFMREGRIKAIKKHFFVKRIQRNFKRFAKAKGEVLMRLNNTIR